MLRSKRPWSEVTRDLYAEPVSDERTEVACPDCAHLHIVGSHCYWCCDRLHGKDDRNLCRGSHNEPSRGKEGAR